MNPALPYLDHGTSRRSNAHFSRVRRNTSRKARCLPVCAACWALCHVRARRSIGRHWPTCHVVSCSARHLRSTTTWWQIRTSVSSNWFFWLAHSPQARNWRSPAAKTVAPSRWSTALHSRHTVGRIVRAGWTETPLTGGPAARRPMEFTLITSCATTPLASRRTGIDPEASFSSPIAKSAAS